MDHASEQQMELEALEAIFGEELQIYNGTLPEGWAAAGETYKVVITPADEGEETEEPIDDELQLELLWAHTAEYPETAPCIKVRAGYGLSNSDVASCQRVLMQQVEENLGMAMIYTILTAAKEWLRSECWIECKSHVCMHDGCMEVRAWLHARMLLRSTCAVNAAACLLQSCIKCPASVHYPSPSCFPARRAYRHESLMTGCTHAPQCSPCS